MFLVKIAPKAAESRGCLLFTRETSQQCLPLTPEGPCPMVSCGHCSAYSFPEKAERALTSSGVQWAYVQLLISPACTLIWGNQCLAVIHAYK